MTGKLELSVYLCMISVYRTIVQSRSELPRLVAAEALRNLMECLECQVLEIRVHWCTPRAPKSQLPLHP